MRVGSLRIMTTTIAPSRKGGDCRPRPIKLFLTLLSLTLCPLPGQVAIPNGAPPSYNLDGRVTEWTNLAPTFILHPSSGGRKGSVWVRQIPEGLLVAGSVDGPTPDFAASTGEMIRKDHVEIWLAPPVQPTFPPFGYDNDEHEVPSIEACGEEQKCRTWFQSMVIHRERLGRTFIRQYELSPTVVTEAFAKPAYDQLLAPIASNFREYVTALAPHGNPVFLALPGDPGGYSFEAMLPWDCFPPFTALRLNELRFMVDVFSAHTGAPQDQPHSSTSLAPKTGDPSSFNALVLEEGRRFTITACGYPLEARNERGERGPALFFPRREDDITQVFRLQNFESIYSYYVSPIAELTDFAEKKMLGNEVVCGPSLAIARNGTVQRFPFDVDQATLDVKLEPDGSYLVLSGPAWKRATASDEGGCCEGASMIHYHIWIISPEGRVRQIFEDHVFMSGVALGVVDMDVEASPDAKKVTSYIALFSTVDKEEHWLATTYCRQGMAYKACSPQKEIKHSKKSDSSQSH
jgi:hypothetical protein